MSMGVKDQGCVFSNFRTSWLVETHSRRTIPGKPLHRRNLNIKAEVTYVNADEAKKLIAVEGYAILDVRDNSQYNRAHIKSCYHVPLFVENQDNDFGKAFFLLACVVITSFIVYHLLCSIYASLKLHVVFRVP